MKLSAVYSRTQYAWVYETGHKSADGDVEVEFISDIFFTDIKSAQNWFDTRFKAEDFINPQIVSVGALNVLSLPGPIVEYKVSYTETHVSDVVVKASSEDEASAIVKRNAFMSNQRTYEGIMDRKITKVVKRT